jgi:uncharacterized membrane protein
MKFSEARNVWQWQSQPKLSDLSRTRGTFGSDIALRDREVKQKQIETRSQSSAVAKSLQPDSSLTTTNGSATPPAPLLQNVQTIAELEAKTSAKRSVLDRFSDRVSDFASSSSFLLIHVGWFSGWIIVNALARHPVDPYPFTFLTFLVSLEAIFLTSFVLISQNHLEAQARRRAALDLQINLLAEREMTSVLRRVTAIAAHLGLSEDDADEEMKELAEQTDVAVVAQTVETLSPQTAPPSSSSRADRPD